MSLNDLSTLISTSSFGLCIFTSPTLSSFENLFSSEGRTVLLTGMVSFISIFFGCFKPIAIKNFSNIMKIFYYLYELLLHHNLKQFFSSSFIFCIFENATLLSEVMLGMHINPAGIMFISFA